MKRIIMTSGGIGSWACARRVADEFGTDDMVLLFADTLIEDEDLYRFVAEVAGDIYKTPSWKIEGAVEFLRYLPTIESGEIEKRKKQLIEWHRLMMMLTPIHIVCDGRTPWEVFEDVRMIGNSRIDPCSRILKRELLDKWRDKNCMPEDTIVYVGIDWTEKHRLDRLQERVKPWKYEAPFCAPPYRLKSEMLKDLESRGIKRPRLYDMGFPHNNCGGFCIKAGHSAFRLLLKNMPERYAEHEAHEARLRKMGIDGTILRDRSGGTTKPVTLKQFREWQEKLEWAANLPDDDLAAGCGCALD